MLKNILSNKDDLIWVPDVPQSLPFINSDVAHDEVGTSAGQLLQRPPDQSQIESVAKADIESILSLLPQVTTLDKAALRDPVLGPSMISAYAIKELSQYKRLLEATDSVMSKRSNGLLSAFRALQSKVVMELGKNVVAIIKEVSARSKKTESKSKASHDKSNVFKDVLVEKHISEVAPPPELPMISASMIATSADREELVEYLLKTYSKLEAEGRFTSGPDDDINNALEYALSQSISATSELVSLIIYMQQLSEGRLKTLNAALYSYDK